MFLTATSTVSFGIAKLIACILKQAQEKLQESSHKLDLLKLALELRSAELPRGSTDRLELERELSSLSPVRYRSAKDSARSGANKPASPPHRFCVLSKPAELTGKPLLFEFVYSRTWAGGLVCHVRDVLLQCRQTFNVSRCEQ